MPHPPTPERLEAAYQIALAALLAERNAEGHWTGELSSSALSTATAVSALALVGRNSSTHQPGANAPRSPTQLIEGGIAWLAAHQNTDGGWGDTTRSISNISTSMLVRAAFHLTGTAQKHADSLHRLDTYLHEHCGPTSARQAESIRARYGKDRTFAVPILTTGALAGFIPWKEVTPLPFELACFPQSWFRFLRLPVVSYALPALIAIGQAIYHHRPPRNPIVRLTRRFALKKSLRVLEAIQPSSGGFLEATPLTSFVTMSLASIGQAEHPVARKGVEFLVNSVRPDGSWPIDSNLATWVTTLAINALAAAGETTVAARSVSEGEQNPSLTLRAGGGCALSHADVAKVRDWLLKQQFKERHPYTGADPGGWGWTDLPGSVPDADDTAGAMLVLRALDEDATSKQALESARDWLFNLQNNDMGMPTFCRGWGKLPFDRSGCDLTAHALRAVAQEIRNWKPNFWTLNPDGPWIFTFAEWSLEYLEVHQRPDGSWLPLWFGNQHAPNDENPTYGTARVLAAYRDLHMMNTDPAQKGVAWLLAAQNADGGWGGAAGVPSSVEETALAVEVLLDAPGADTPESPPARAVNKGLAWLVVQVETGGLYRPTPIGFYFAKLWYFENLYPIIFSVAALGRARRLTRREDTPP